MTSFDSRRMGNMVAYFQAAWNQKRGYNTYSLAGSITFKCPCPPDSEKDCQRTTCLRRKIRPDD